MRTMTTGSTSASRIRRDLAHPVIDADAHWIEPIPIFADFLRDEGGPKALVKLRAMRKVAGLWYGLTPADRARRRVPRPPWWFEPGSTIDRATAMLPALLEQRLDEFGIDVALVYPTTGFLAFVIPDEDLRRQWARAANRMAAELFAPHSNRLRAAAVIPAHGAAEAVEELRHGVGELGLDIVVVSGHVRRAVPGPNAQTYVDFLGLDNEHDYDVFWAACVDAGVAVTAHGAGYGWDAHRSPSSFVFNHVGHFAANMHGFCRALVLGGVLRRFPQLRFAFLEAGVAWAAGLYHDLATHWAFRSPGSLRAPVDLDLEQLRSLFESFGGARLSDRWQDVLQQGLTFVDGDAMSVSELTAREPNVDEFAASGINDADDLRRVFERQIFVGCEGGDPTTRWAFDRRSGVRINAVLGTDIGHGDVADMSRAVADAYELVSTDVITSEDFRDLAFENVVRLHGSLNRDFFRGTPIEDAAAAVLARET
jgi:predicted TIM-barrel fold metal-dependent hydrolase